MKKILLLAVGIILFVGTYYASSFLPFNKANRFRAHITDNSEIQRLQ